MGGLVAELPAGNESEWRSYELRRKNGLLTETTLAPPARLHPLAPASKPPSGTAA